MNIELTLNTELPLSLYDKNGNEIYYKNSNGCWWEAKYDENSNKIYYKNSDGCWWESKYDESGKEIYYKDSTGYEWIAPKVELTLDEIADKFGIDIKQLKIKK